MPRPNPMMEPDERKKIRIDVRKVVNGVKLTDRQRVFIKEYIANGNNGTQAAIKAGYSKKAARQAAVETLSKPYIEQEKDRLMSKIADEAGCTKEFVLKRLKTASDLCFEEYGSTALKALELIGKHHGLFTEKQEVTVKGHEDWLEDIKDE